MKISTFIPIVYGIIILTNQAIAADRELVKAIVREVERDAARTRTDQNNNSPRESDRNASNNNNDRR